jgi:hypothetical protein
LILAILTGVRWNLSVALICISFYNQGSWAFLYVFTGHLYLFENSLFNSCAHLFIGCWFFGGWVFWVPCRFWMLVPYQMSSWQRSSPIL